MIRQLQRIIATTDVHSTFDDILPMLSHLHTARTDSLVVDCGDFFEGSGYYRLAEGRIERSLLTTLYAVIAPGNHGWAHHFEPDLHRLTVCANAVDDTSGDALFRRLHLADIGGRRVAVTGVIALQAFSTIPRSQRAGHRVTDPVQALRELMLVHQHEVDAWVLLSHSGFDEDLKLAAACPFLDVIFAGHCHSNQYGPVHVGDTLVLKGRELAVGYAQAKPIGQGWGTRADLFLPTWTPLPPELADAQGEIEELSNQLAAPLGTITETYRYRLPDRRELLAEVTARLHTGLGAEAVVLNETALRPVQLGDTLTIGDLLATEPFDNQLVHAHLPDDQRDFEGLLARLAEEVGPLVTTPAPLPTGARTVLTTDYLAETFLGGRTQQAALRLGQSIQHVLIEGVQP
ncbi:metallophosphoesterase [Streptomyces sp. NPDC048416]|uniref:metallophosphoesterase n=1 Tax=Streptomyces sp. NPDC048416 TaxID=3365546 RepID=UPI0037154322